MRKLLILGCLCFLNCSNDDKINFKNTETTTKKVSVLTLGGSKNDVAKAVFPTEDGGFIFTGYTQSKDGDIKTKNNESFDFWIVKLSNQKTIEWQKTFGGSKDDRAADIIQTSDGGFAVLGFSRSNDKDVTNNSGSQDFWLLKLTPIGTLEWKKNFGFSGADYGTALLETSDNGFLVTGALDVSASGGQGNAKTSKRHAGGDYWAIKTDNSGNLEWSRYFGGSFTDTPLGIVKTSKNNYLIIGSSDSNDVDIKNSQGTYDFWIVKINTNGNLIWEKSFGGSEIDEARGIVATNNGNFIVVGDTRSSNKNVKNNNGAADVWIIKIDANGNLIWEKTIGGSNFDVARSISKTQDNGFLISGSSRSSNNGFNNKGQNDALILKIDTNGNLLWQKTIGGSEIDFLYDAVELKDKTILAVGESNSANQDIPLNKGFSDALIIEIK